MAEDRYPSFFPKFATERSKEMCLWMVDWDFLGFAEGQDFFLDYGRYRSVFHKFE